MTPTPIDRLLSRALLVQDPDVPAEAGDYPPDSYTSGLFEPLDDDLFQPDPAINDQEDWRSADELRMLCELVISRGAGYLDDWVTDQLPGPGGARVLGCIMQLIGDGYGARFWWQYATGSYDRLASYCLYLHHLTLGEAQAADWWHEEYLVASYRRPAPKARGHWAAKLIADADTSIPTLIRVLHQQDKLSGDAPYRTSEAVTAVMEFVPRAVSVNYVHGRDGDLPLLRPEFAGKIVALLGAADGIDNPRPRPSSLTPPDQPARREPDGIQWKEQKDRVAEPVAPEEVEVELTPAFTP